MQIEHQNGLHGLGANGRLDVITTSGIITTNRIEPRHLIELAEDRARAIIIKGYVPSEVCRSTADKIDRDSALTAYTNAPDIRRLGTAYFEVTDLSSRENYFSGAISRMDHIRSLYHPFASPLDRVFRELDERWDFGASNLRLAGRRMSAGIVRSFDEGSEAEPHADNIGWDDPIDGPATGISHTLAVNIYLRPSTSGGELELWQERLSKFEYDAKKRAGSYGLLRELIPPPAVVIHPEEGDLVVFNASRTHAVRPTVGVSRITHAAFIGYRGRDRSLVYWS